MTKYDDGFFSVRVKYLYPKKHGTLIEEGKCIRRSNKVHAFSSYV